MVPSPPMGGAQPIHSSLLRSNSGMLGAQGGPMPSQGAFPSLVPPRPHCNNGNLLGNAPSVSPLLHQSFGNGSPSSLVQSSTVNTVSSNQVQGQQFLDQSGNQMLADHQLEPQTFQHPQQRMQQFSAPLSNQPQQQQQQQQQQFQSIRGGLGGISQVKLEPQVNNEQHLPQQQQQLQSLRALGQVKLEPHQLQSIRNQPQVKMEPQHSEHSVLLRQQQQQQQQQLLQISRQSPQAGAGSQLNLLQQHRLLQLQQQQQQHQLLKALPQQRSQMQQQFQAQNLPVRSPVKPMYEVGACARRFTQYMHQQQNRPEDNNIEFWRKFVAEFFAPNSKKKCCVSMYGGGRQTTGVFPQDVWHCEICSRKPGRGFEAAFEVLPRLFKIKYESGTLEELLYVDMPREYHNPSGQIVLDYAKAIEESVYEQLRVVRDGQLRIVFSPDLKIYSWVFCARRHEELIPRRLLLPQVGELGAAAQKYQAASQNASTNSSVTDLHSSCDMFLTSAKQLVKALEVPLVNDLGYTKRYVRCLQISEVVNSMKDLIDHSRITGTGPMDCLAKFSRRANASSCFQTQTQSSKDQQQQQLQQQPQTMIQNSNNEQASTSQVAGMQLVPSHGVPSVNNSLNASSTSNSVITINGHQNSMVSRPQNPMASTSSPFAPTSLPSPVSLSTMQPLPVSQSNPSPFQSPTPPFSNNSPPQPPSNNGLSNTTSHINTANSPANVSMQQQQQQSPLLSNGDPTSQSSVQQIIQEMMLYNQLNGRSGIDNGSLGNDMKNINGILPSNNSGLNGSNCLANSNPGFGFGDMGSGMGQASMLNGARAAISGNPIVMNGRVGMASIGRHQGVSFQQQQDLSNQFLNGFGSSNGVNNLQFDWKPSP